MYIPVCATLMCLYAFRHGERPKCRNHTNALYPIPTWPLSIVSTNMEHVTFGGFTCGPQLMEKKIMPICEPTLLRFSFGRAQLCKQSSMSTITHIKTWLCYMGHIRTRLNVRRKHPLGRKPFRKLEHARPTIHFSSFQCRDDFVLTSDQSIFRKRFCLQIEKHGMVDS